MEIKGFITNLGKYNEGELIGEWITFPIEDSDFNEIMEKIGCKYYDWEAEEFKNEEYEEFFFTDWDTDFDNDFNEYEDIEKINEIAATLDNWDEDLLSACCEIWDTNEVLDNDPNDYSLYPDVHSDEELGYYWVEESGCYNLNNLGNLRNYINYEAFGRDVRLEADGGFTSYGWVEKH
jgi:antirestriction protein